MTIYLFGIGLLVVGSVLVLVNSIVFLSEYKIYTSSNSQRKKSYFILIWVSMLLSILCIIEGVINVFVVYSQLN